MIRFLRIDPMVSGSNPPSAKLSLGMRRVANSLYFKAYELDIWFKIMMYILTFRQTVNLCEMTDSWSLREEEPGHC